MKFSILKVNGSSMYPALKSGIFVFVWYSKQLFQQTHLFCKLPIVGPYLASTMKLKVGDIVVVSHSKYGQIIKRVTVLDFDNKTFYDLKGRETTKGELKRVKLCGDNSMVSVSEKAMGWIDVEQIIGKIIYTVER